MYNDQKKNIIKADKNQLNSVPIIIFTYLDPFTADEGPQLMSV